MKAAKATSSNSKSQKIAGTTSSDSEQDAVTLLKQDHREVEALFKKYQSAGENEKREIVRQVCTDLIVHALLEEEIFYKACRQQGVESKDLDEAQVEHDSAKMLILELLSGSPSSAYFDAKVAVLSEYIKHHVGEEEKPGEGIFAKAQKKGLDMRALGQRLQTRKKELLEKAEANELGPPRPRALQLQLSQEYQENRNMPRYSNDRDRDERGRFREDDEGRYSRSQSSSRRSSYDDDDDRRGSRGRSEGRGWYGDSEGHSEAARSRGGSSRSSRDYDDDDDRESRGRGRGGWFGDSEGHAEAARDRWEDDRSGSRSRSSGRYDDDDDRGRGSRSRSSSYDDDDDGRRGSRSRSSGRYEDDDDRGGRGGGRGWFGDSEGHAEAARERWEDDDRGRGSRSRASSRDDDEENRGGRSRSGGEGHGGWFGDSRGHAQAARRGWRNRD
jgi:hypothetical protein